MSVVYQPGQELTNSDLRIFLKDRDGVGVNIYEILYSLYWWRPSSKTWESVSSQWHLVPENGPAAGQYWAAWNIPQGQHTGDYQIRWDFRKSSSDPFQQTQSVFCIVKLHRGSSRTAVVSDLYGTPYVIVY